MGGISSVSGLVTVSIRRFLKMTKTAVAGLSIFILSGCGAEYLLLTPPGLVVAAPVGGTLILAEGPEIVQPVMVQSASGEVLTPPFEGGARAKLTVNDGTIVCTGKHQLRLLTVVTNSEVQGGYSTYYKIPLSCNKDLKGRAFTSVSLSDQPRFHLEVGPKHVPLKKSGRNYVLGEAWISCSNDYRVRTDPVEPFRVHCDQQPFGQSDNTIGVVAQKAQGQNAQEFTVWIFPAK